MKLDQIKASVVGKRVKQKGSDGDLKMNEGRKSVIDSKLKRDIFSRLNIRK